MTKPAPYQEIANFLREQILSGKLAPGDLVPSEPQLAAQFKVTRKTATRAIEQLRSEGLIVTAQGARSKVRSRPRFRHVATGENFRDRQATGKPNDIAEAEAQGYKSRNELLERAEVPAPAKVAKQLGVDAGTKVIMRHLLHFAVEEGKPDEPMKVLRCYYRRDFAAGTALAESDKIPGGIACLIESPDGPFRRTIAKFTEDVELRMPRPDEVKALAIPPGVPVARILRTMYDVSGEPLEVLDSILPGDRYDLYYVIAIPEKP